MPDRTRPDLAALIAEAKAQWEARTDDERRAMLAAQAASWVRGERGLDRDEAADPTPHHRRSPMEHERDAGPDLPPEVVERIKAEVMTLETPYGLCVFAEDYAELRARAELAEAEAAAEFSRGYLIACCNLVNLHDQPEVAFDVLREMNLTRQQVKAMGLSEYDARALREIEKARGSNSVYAIDPASVIKKGE